MKSFTLAVFFAVVLGLGCGSEELPTETEYRAEVVREEGKIFIVDQTGKRWEVTHAVNKYGFVAEEFQFGLGPDAIRPILDPKHIDVGQEGYPADDAKFIVLGTRVKYRARAYPIEVMAIHEVVDEVFGDAHVAVTF